MADIYVYTNTKTGESFAFGDERPDLEARPNWVRGDPNDVSDLVKEQVQASSQTARMITDAMKPVDPPETAKTSGLGGIPVAEEVPPMPSAGLGGVLSRNVIVGPGRAEREAQAAADTESIALHGTLAANADGSQTRVHVDALNADVVNAPPVGDTGSSPVKKRAAAVRKATQQRQKAQDKTADENARQARAGGPAAAPGVHRPG